MSNHPTNPHILSKSFASTRSCQDFLCLTKRCHQQQAKQKQKILNSSYFSKLSLKQFTNPSVMFNQSFFEREKKLKRDRSTEDSQFRNVVINSSVQDVGKFSIGGHVGHPHHHIGKVNSSPSYNQFSDSTTQRIIRSSSYRQLDNHPPQLKTVITDKNHSLQKQLQNDYRKISDLSRLRSQLQHQISELDDNIDQYYGIYQAKLEELKKIQSRIRAVEKLEDKEKTLVKMPSTDELTGKFRKKTYVGEVEHGIGRSEVVGDVTARRVEGVKSVANVVYKKTEQRTYFHNTNISFVKKTN